MGVTPNTFLNILMQQNTKEKNYLLMTDKMLLPPTYAPPESTQGTVHILRKHILWLFIPPHSDLDGPKNSKLALA